MLWFIVTIPILGSVQVMLFKDRLEIWNPGRLPHGMTIEKLNSRHNSQPVNPVLANPVYLTGYIEQMGTGTTDIIEQCESYGLRKPEFIQEDDFLTILWRPKKDDVDNATDQVTDQVTDHVTGNVAGNVAGNVKRLILCIGNETLAREEIMQKLGLKGSGNFRATYLYPAIEQGYVSRLYPDSAKRPDQAYYLTEKGLDLLVTLEQS